MFSLVLVVLVDVVEEEPEALPAGELDQGLERLPRDDASGRVVRRVEVERHGPRSELSLHGLDHRLRGFGHAEERHFDGTRAETAADPVDEGPVRRQEEHLVSRLGHRPDGVREARRRTAGDDELAPLDGDAGPGADPLDERVDEFRQPLRRRVTVEVRVVGRAEILHGAPFRRLAPCVSDVEGIDLAPVRGEPVEELGVDGALDLRDR